MARSNFGKFYAEPTYWHTEEFTQWYVPYTTKVKKQRQ